MRLPDAQPAACEVDWRDVAASLAHGVVVLDDDARIVACNPAAEHILGSSAGELRGLGPRRSTSPSWPRTGRR
jgi:PAS domain S-box-containing protein